MDFMKSMKKSWNVVLTAALVAAVTLGLGACSSMDSDASDQVNMTRTKAQAGPGMHDHQLMAEVAGMEDGALMLKTKTGMETAQVEQDLRGVVMGLAKGDKVIVDYQHTNDVLIVTGIRQATAADMEMDYATEVDWDDDMSTM